MLRVKIIVVLQKGHWNSQKAEKQKKKKNNNNNNNKNKIELKFAI